ncbi:hypothetical protein R1sor_013763 [Riccia sorocarpa]|uniref:Uncharacterized protein n=1 Tax=Riccia sorocarpa TaxID=122646 RepID=A0ABD3HDQ4_9MARC
MALSEVAAMGTNIITVAQSIKDHGEQWYKQSSGWEKFPTQLADLRQKHTSLISILTRSGIVFETADTALMEQMLILHNQLDVEESRLDRMSGGCFSCCFPKMTGFPSKIGISFGCRGSTGAILTILLSEISKYGQQTGPPTTASPDTQWCIRGVAIGAVDLDKFINQMSPEEMHDECRRTGLVFVPIQLSISCP